jgi:hypothetical protein
LTVKNVKKLVLSVGAVLLVFGFLGWLSNVIGILWVFGALMVVGACVTRWDLNRACRRSEERRLRASALDRPLPSGDLD